MCACLWGGIFTSETQNGFINSIRGWHFPHPHARQKNQCFPLQEYCSPHLSLSLLLTACIKLHTTTGSCAFPPWISGTLRICSNSAQPSNKPIMWENVSIWTHSPMAVSLQVLTAALWAAMLLYLWLLHHMIYKVCAGSSWCSKTPRCGCHNSGKCAGAWMSQKPYYIHRQDRPVRHFVTKHQANKYIP